MIFFFLLFPLFFGQESIGRLVLLEDALKDGAACLDGSAPAYYVSQGWGSGINKWYVHHEGGGWCYNLDECLQRSTTRLGTSKLAPKSLNFTEMGGYFASNEKVNTLMYNWNKVLFYYCDGGSFSGNNATVTMYKSTKLHFKGFRNLLSYKKDLDFNHGFRKATDVVISGCSAGGLATYLHLDWWRQNIISRTKVIGLPDSGFFLDYDTPACEYGQKMRWVFNQMNSTEGVNQKCISGNKGHAENCIFAEHTAPHIVTSYFPMQSVYDSWQLGNILGKPAENDPKEVNKYGDMTKERFLASVIKNKVNGGFLDSCKHHCGAWDQIVINGKDINHAFTDFLP
jgi:hypothetical protein